MVEEIRLQDRVEMRKAHPCGSKEWVVIRIGADIKIRCLKCERIVMMDRTDFLRRRRRLIEQGPEAAGVSLGLQPKPPHEGENSDDRS